MSNEPKKDGSPWPLIIVGLILLVAGSVWAGQGMPDFEVKMAEQGIPIDLAKTVATAGMLLVLFQVVRMFYITPLVTAVNERNDNLERTFAEAEDLRAQMQQMKSDYERRLNETEAGARAQIQASVEEAKALGTRLKAEASSQIDDMKKRAQEEMELERQRIMGEIRNEVVTLTLGATEKLIGENMDDTRNRKLIDEFLAGAGAAR